MGFLDKVFGPKYNKHDSYEKREEAVKKINDESVLAEIAKEDKSDVICGIAIDKITNGSILADIVEHAPKEKMNVRKKAVEKINDKLILKNIIINLDKRIGLAKSFPTKDLHKEICLIALDKIDEESLLIDIVKNTKYITDKVVEKINDENFLEYVAKNNSSSFNRKIAVKKISSESVLAYVAKNDQDNDTAREAIKKINNESILIDIAKDEHLYSGRRVDAIDKISDKNVLLELTKDSTYYVTYNRDGNYSHDEFKGTEVKNYPIKNAAEYRLKNSDICEKEK